MVKRILKTPELIKAKRAVLKFLRKYNLNPFKDYSNHPKYGRIFKDLILKLNIERDKVLTKYPQTDSKRFKKYQKMKKEKKEKKAAAKAAEEKKKVTKKAEKVSKPSKYDYPLVDGREMTSDEKKKYRAEQRKLAKGETAKPKKKAKAEKPSKKVEKVEEKPSKKVKKSKKAKKEED